jgi:hypothetical protein
MFDKINMKISLQPPLKSDIQKMIDIDIFR